VGSVPLSCGFPNIFGPFSPGPGSGVVFLASSSFSSAGPWHAALGRKLDRKCQRVCSIAAPASIPGREALRAQELPAAKDDVTALPSTPKTGIGTAARRRFNPATPRAQILYRPLLRTLPAFSNCCYCSRAWPDKQLIVPEPQKSDGNRQSTRLLARRSRDAELWRLLGQRSHDAVLKRKAENEPLREKLPRGADEPACSGPSGEAEHPGCVPTAAAPSQSSLPALRCSGAGSARSRTGMRPARSRQPPGSAPAAGTGSRYGQPELGSAARSEACTYPLLRSAASLRLFVSAADGSPERSRLFPAMAELTSNCCRSPWFIVVSFIITIALWCCIVLLPFGLQHNTATRSHSIYAYSSMQVLTRCG